MATKLSRSPSADARDVSSADARDVTSATARDKTSADAHDVTSVGAHDHRWGTLGATLDDTHDCGVTRDDTRDCGCLACALKWDRWKAREGATSERGGVVLILA